MMIKKDKYNINSVIVSVVFVLAVSILLYTLFGYYFEIDDIGMRMIESGAYNGVPDGHMEFLSYVFGMINAFLYSNIPSVDWHGLMVVASAYFAMFAVVYRITDDGLFFKNRIASAGFAVLAFISLAIYHMLRAQYTHSSIICGCAFLFFYATNDWKSKSRINVLLEQICCALLGILSFGLRQKAFYPYIIAWVLLYLYRNISIDDKRIRFNNIKFVSAVFFTLIAMYVINIWAYSDGEYAELKEANVYRSRCIDYEEMPEYDIYSDIYMEYNISKEEYDLVGKYGRWIFLKDISADRIKDFSLVYRTVYADEFKSLKNLPNAIKTAILGFFEGVNGKYPYPVRLAEYFAIICCYALFFRLRDKKGILITTALLCLFAMFWIYLGFDGRFIERVRYNLHLGLCVSLLAMLYNEYRIHGFEIKKIKNVNVLLALLLAVFMILFLEAYNTHYNMSSMFEKYYGLDTIYEVFNNNPENIYLVYGELPKIPEKFKLFKDVSDRNYYYCGGWQSILPVYREMLSQGGMIDSAEAPILRDNIYLVRNGDFEDYDWLINYYRSIGWDVEPEVELVTTDEGYDFTFVKVVLNEDH